MKKFSKFAAQFSAPTSQDVSSRAREYMSQVCKVSEKTHEDYLKKFDRIKRTYTDESIDLSEIAKTKNSFYAMRASLIYGACFELNMLLKERDRARKEGNKELSSELLKRIKLYVSWLDKYQPQSMNPVNSEAPKNLTGVQHSKKNDAKAWDNKELLIKLFEHMPKSHHYALSLMILTGARPEEIFSDSVKISGCSIRILGAKCDEQKGQEWRSFTLEPQSFDNLDSLCFKTLSEGSLDTSSYDAFRRALTRASKSLAPKKPLLSPYVFRHLFASRLKSDAVDRESIAYAMGHAVTETARYYGTTKKSGRKSHISNFNGSKTVKVNHEPSASIQQKNQSIQDPMSSSSIDDLLSKYGL